jgi:hypothetical protein
MTREEKADELILLCRLIDREVDPAIIGWSWHPKHGWGVRSIKWVKELERDYYISLTSDRLDQLIAKAQFDLDDIRKNPAEWGLK